MSEDSPAPAQKPKSPLSAKAAREARLAQNLRDNLRRRKAAARKASGENPRGK